jgi:hypothetical protein
MHVMLHVIAAPERFIDGNNFTLGLGSASVKGACVTYSSLRATSSFGLDILSTRDFVVIQAMPAGCGVDAEAAVLIGSNTKGRKEGIHGSQAAKASQARKRLSWPNVVVVDSTPKYGPRLPDAALLLCPSHGAVPGAAANHALVIWCTTRRGWVTLHTILPGWTHDASSQPGPLPKHHDFSFTLAFKRRLSRRRPHPTILLAISRSSTARSPFPNPRDENQQLSLYQSPQQSVSSRARQRAPGKTPVQSLTACSGFRRRQPQRQPHQYVSCAPPSPGVALQHPTLRR